MLYSMLAAIWTIKTRPSHVTRSLRACQTWKVITIKTKVASGKRRRTPKVNSCSKITSTICKSRLLPWKPRSSYWRIEKLTKRTKPLATKLFSATEFLWTSISWLLRTNSTTKRMFLRNSSNPLRTRWRVPRRRTMPKRTESRFCATSTTLSPKS